MTLTAAQISVSSGSLSFSTSTAGVTATATSLAAGVSGTITLTVMVGNAAGSITNAVGVTSTTPDPVPSNNTSTRVISRLSNADVSVTLAVSPLVSAGQTANGTVTFYNLGSIPALDVTRTLVVSSGTLTGVATGGTLAGAGTATFNVASMALGSTASYTFTYVVPAAGTVSFTATVATTTPESSTANNTTTAATIVASAADVSVTLAIPASAPAGSTVAATVTFYNLGNIQADNVTRTLVLGGGTVTAVAAGGTIAGAQTATFNAATMPPGSTASYTFTYVMPTAGQVGVTASVATTTTETSTANNLAIGLTAVSGVGVDLSVSLTVSPTLLVAGSNTVSVTVTNVGAVSTTGTLVITLPGSTVSFTLTSPLSAGQNRLFTTNYNLPALTTAAQTFTAVVTATGGAETNLTNNSTTVVVGVGARLQGLAWMDLNRDRAFQAGEIVLPNLLVRLYNSSSVVVGTAFTGSDGKYDISGVPAGSGYRVEFFSCVDKNNLSTCNNISTTPINQASLTEFNNPSTGITTATTSTSGRTIGLAISSVTLYAGDNTVNQNLPLDPRGIVYDSVTRAPVAGATVRITGPGGFDPATHLVDLNGAAPNNESVTDVNGLYQFIFIGAPPAGTYNLTVVSAPGYKTTPAISGGVAAPNVIGGVLTSPYVVPNAATNMQANYPAPGSPPVGTNGSAAVGAAGTQYAFTVSFAFGGGYIGELFNNNIPLDPVAAGGGGGGGAAPGDFDLAITKQGPSLLGAGGTGTFTLVITNAGPTSAPNATVTDVMPAGLTLLSASVRPANAMNLAVAPTGLVASTASLPVGLTTITLVVQANASAVGTTITNIASVASSLTETLTTNNSSSATVVISGVDLRIVKTGPAAMAAGGTATYVLTVVNAGPSTAPNVTVTDALPSGLTAVSASVLSGSLTIANGTGAVVTAVAPNMPVGTSVIAITVAVGETLVGSVTNLASVYSSLADLQPSNNVSTVTSAILGADLAIIKLGPPTISAAGTATYTLVVANYGPSTAGNVTVTDVIPAGLTLVGAKIDGSMSLAVTPDKFVASTSVVRLGTQTITLTVQAAYTATGTITNIAQVTSTTPDPTPSNNTGSATSVIKEVEPGVILVNKTGNKTVAEVGDSLQYTIRMRNTIGVPVAKVTLEDLLPAGFRYILGTARLNGVALADPAGGIGRQLVFDIGTIPGQTTYELTYFVRLGVGSQQGDGINRATAIFPGARGTPIRSNTAMYKVVVQGGVFSNEGCIVGKVYVDCDGNSAQSNDGGSRELGIPGVRLVMLDGSFIVTDNEGKYSICGVQPQTHVIKVDRTTLPKGSRLLPSSNRNAGVGDSIFVDLRAGELHRADFIEGSCSPEVLDQVKARRAQGGVATPQVEKPGLPLKLDSKPGEPVPILPVPRVPDAAPAEAKP
jgi:uncharacterized repeat protein (TIGR01451 family)